MKLVFLLLATLLAIGNCSPSNHFISFFKRRDRITGHFDQTFRLPEKPFYATLQPHATLVASPSTIQKSGDPVTITWSGVTGPKNTDWIGLYLSSGASDTDYLDFLYVDESPTYDDGYGSLTFNLINMRSAYQFRYFQYRGSNAYNLIAVSNTMNFANLNEPLQGHIALTGDFDEMRVMFVTASFHTPVVEYGRTSGVYTNRATGTSVTYSADMICGSPANITSAGYFINPGVMHDVLLVGLAPSTKYYYRYGTAEYGFSEERYFRTAPLPGTPKVRLIAYGDLGVTTPGPQGTVELVTEEIDETDLILHFGDLSYAMGHGYMWDQYMSFVEEISTKSPNMVSIGNHEYCYLVGGENDPSGAPGNGFHPSWGNYGADSGNECGVPMYYRYHMPDNGNSLFWYSFNYGNLHIIQMSTEHDFLPGSPQYIWMEKDLASVNRSETPFVIFTGHRPMYNSEIYPSDFRVCENMQIAFEDLLIRYKVDVAFYGHYHSYERTCPVYKNVCDEENGLVHITVGSAGAWVDLVPHYAVEWSEFTEQDYGYCRLTADDSKLFVEFIRNRDNRVIDTVTFPRKF